jgi:uncharacterized protein with PIN domain
MHTNRASFHFYGSLNDFLPYAKRDTRFEYNFSGTPAIKDAIEALGVPHPEVAGIVVNNKPVTFKYLLQPADQVAVYPTTGAMQKPEFSLKEEAQPPVIRFILDVHLGKLARSLRMLGFDTLYENNYSDALITNIAEKENRIVLTRDVGLLKNRKITWGYWLRSQLPKEQLIEVIKRFNLQNAFQPLSRCLECNGKIWPVEKEKVLEQLPPKTRLYFQEFYQCSSCRRVYWKGSHYEKMVAFISKFQTSGE